MTVAVFPDIEKALLKYLITVPEVTTLVSSRVWAEPGPDPTYPFLTVRKLSSRTGVPRWLEACTVEVAGWSHKDVASARTGARLVCETGVASLNLIVNRVLDGCVVTGPVAITGPRSVPNELAPGVTYPRFIGEVSFTYHPQS